MYKRQSLLYSTNQTALLDQSNITTTTWPIKTSLHDQPSRTTWPIKQIYYVLHDGQSNITTWPITYHQYYLNKTALPYQSNTTTSPMKHRYLTNETSQLLGQWTITTTQPIKQTWLLDQSNITTGLIRQQYYLTNQTSQLDQSNIITGPIKHHYLTNQTSLLHQSIITWQINHHFSTNQTSLHDHYYLSNQTSLLLDQPNITTWPMKQPVGFKLCRRKRSILEPKHFSLTALLNHSTEWGAIHHISRCVLHYLRNLLRHVYGSFDCVWGLQ